jgi:hypothetical protein
MHPDAYITGLRRELGRLDSTADDYEARRTAIEEEIERAGALPRPVVTAEKPDTVADQDDLYLAGLRRELERAPSDRHAEIEDEIERVEQLIREKPAKASTVQAEEDEQLEDLSKAQLLERVEAAGIVPPKRASKADLIELLSSGELVPDGFVPVQVLVEIGEDGSGSLEVDGTAPEALLNPTLLGVVDPSTQEATPCEGVASIGPVQDKPEDACVNVVGAPKNVSVAVQYFAQPA